MGRLPKQKVEAKEGKKSKVEEKLEKKEESKQTYDYLWPEEVFASIGF